MKRMIVGAEYAPVSMSWTFNKRRGMRGLGGLGVLPPEQTNALLERMGPVYDVIDDLATQLNNLAATGAVSMSVVSEYRDQRIALQEQAAELQQRIDALEPNQIASWNVSYEHLQLDTTRLAQTVRSLLRASPQQQKIKIGIWVGIVLTAAIGGAIAIRYYGGRRRA